MMSERTGKKNHFRTVIGIILFILIFSVIMRIMNFFLVQSNWASIDRWEQYSAGKDIDTLFVGSSVGWVVVTDTIDGQNGCRCANLSTPNQFYKTSLGAVKFVSGQQPLKTVVLMTGFEALESAEDYAAAIAFTRAQYETAPVMKREGAVFAQKIERYTDIDFLTSVDSINIWFDWVESCTHSTVEIMKNYVYRMGRLDPGYHLDMTESIERADPKGAGAKILDEDIMTAHSLGLSHIDIDERSLKNLDEMASYLAANGIRFVVIVPPHRSDVRKEYGTEYDVMDTYLEEFVTKRGGEYHNIDRAPDLREQLPDDMFMDREHIVDEGNKLVSSYIAMLLRGK